ncbi:glycine/betaine ABC transporter permease [Defluviimonas sp. 20V17]|uniref:Choline ABC transporter permease subunit n=1 Tax=Allgaiera indica TaxID=765699 RepID=A0AAN4UNT4_9RHOB|nr:choline ABC transporter permease subunit [Allgaiera indica]KDB04083.1 glycine/betaine ABC transporter permease [Defluviimonas sp. 20V17]GHD99429.1 choline ABC transporter permease subunit [Allgaiera indica]SDW25831.1 glycine betaine/proline transport system permease protein [Allgaiera indica]
MNWITDHKIPVGRVAADLFNWLQNHAGWFFDGLSIMMERMIGSILSILQFPVDAHIFQRIFDDTVWLLLLIPAVTFKPFAAWLYEHMPILYTGYKPLYPDVYQPYVVVAAFVLLTWFLQRSWKIGLLVLLGFLFILNQGYWQETTQSLTLVLAACVVCMGIGVPIGIFLAHRPRTYQVVSPLLDLMQTLPPFVYLIPAIIFFGLGMVPGLIATVIFVLPAPIRLTQLGISSTPTTLLEAATAFGSTPRQRLWKVELPYAFPQIMAGLNQTIMLSLSMVVIAAYVGADGLGVPVVRALSQVNTALGFESGFIIVVVAVLLDRMLRVTRK